MAATWSLVDKGAILNLFQLGEFALHGGASSKWKLDCDALTAEDLRCLAYLINQRVARFSRVEGVPRGGLRLAMALQDYALPGTDFPLLIVDDVLTTGKSMEEQRGGRPAIGAVLFARGQCPQWVKALFVLNNSPLMPYPNELFKFTSPGAEQAFMTTVIRANGGVSAEKAYPDQRNQPEGYE